MHDDGSSDYVIHGPVIKHVLDVQVKVLLVGADGPYQLCDVVGVQGAGLRGQTAGQVRVADVGHALQTERGSFGTIPWQTAGRNDSGGCTDLVHRQLPGNGGLDVPSSLGSQVHHHRAIFHAFNHLLGDEDGSTLACAAAAAQI